MKNVTVTLDEETARGARVEGARQDVSVSAPLRDILERAKAAHESYPEALHRCRSRAPVRLKARARYPSRDALHDRDRLR